ncbi:FxSxx-COOH system tetratricopeptide repeat protein [Longispora sp. K20-0274]|uniref:FxSxx-COOH system tetratricopeptide repeat protein n=1 Tax=Longispora sp. K20-0274 TaxID=3088255 RepID=UPI00399BD1D5
MPLRLMDRISAALAGVALLKDVSGRDLCVAEAQAELRRDVPVRRQPLTPADLHSILRAFEAESGGLAVLLRTVASLSGSTEAVATAQHVLADWELTQVIRAVPADTLVAVAAAVTGTTVPAADHAAILDLVGWQNVDGYDVPAVLAFACVLSAGPGPDRARIERWVSETAYALAVTDSALDRLRRAASVYWESARSGRPGTLAGPVQEEVGSTVPTTIIIGEATTNNPPAVIRSIPQRNQHFVGREDTLAALESSLGTQHRASLLPEASLHGAGGVGKSQLAAEFCYRHIDRYQLTWWIPAEDLGTVRSSLAALADRMGLPPSPNMEQRIRTVLDTLSTTPLSWLLVYDNADDPAELAPLMPAANMVGEHGHVLVTTRNGAWAAAAGATIEVDVFSRTESLALLGNRLTHATESEADLLAEKLGDLPLALDQAASWLLTMPASVEEYLEDFDRNASRLLAEGQPRGYSGTVHTIVALALPKLRERAPAAAQLLELLTYLAPEPVPMRLLWEGRAADVPEPLRTALQERNDISRAIRDLGSVGLVKVDNGNRRLQIHRLVHRVIREGLDADADAQGRRNAQQLLAAANPGYPDDRSTWPRHAEITPHLRSARLIDGDISARRTVQDQVRYLYNLGDFEGCRALAEETLTAWDVPDPDGAPNADPLTLLALRRYSDALRALGDPAAAATAALALERMRASLGEDHQYTLGAANGVGADLRQAGDVAAATELDTRNLAAHRRILGDADPSTLRVMNSVAMDLRLSGDFAGAYAINLEVERHARTLEDGEIAIVLAQEAQARDLYLLGRYADAADLLLSSLPVQRGLLGPDHLTVVRATCVHTACLRKIGRLAEAAEMGVANYRTATRRFGTDHVMAAETGMTAANALRALGDAREAHAYGIRAHAQFRRIYGERHPVTLCAAVNLAAILRAREFDRDAALLNEATLTGMRAVLPGTHPYLLSARTGQAMNIVRAHRLAEAQRLSAEIMADSRRIRGPEHVYTHYCEVNAAVDLIQTGDEETGLPLLEAATAALTARFGAEHPEVESARNQRRIECDIETIGLA